MENTFHNFDGIYYFSLNNTINLELLCLDSMNNARINLSGIGNIRIKNNCYAKYKSLLLSGSSHVLLNQSYQISLIHPIHFKQNFSLFRNTISNLSFPTLKEFSSSEDLEYLDTNPESTKVISFLNLEVLLSFIASVIVYVFITICFHNYNYNQYLILIYLYSIFCI